MIKYMTTSRDKHLQYVEFLFYDPQVCAQGTLPCSRRLSVRLLSQLYKQLLSRHVLRHQWPLLAKTQRAMQKIGSDPRARLQCVIIEM